MGVPTQAQAHAWTDHLAALIQLNLAGFNNELTAATLNDLWTQVDASGDPAVENALLAYARAVDNQSLPENYYVALNALLGRGALRNFAAGLADQVVTNGGYANFRAYLADKTATLHPLYAELHRAVAGEGAFTDSDGDITTVFAPNYVARSADRVYVGADGSLSEETTDADDVGTADITLFGSDNHALYVGSRYKFSQLVVALSTLASATITPTFQYWNGSAWATLSVTDNGAGFTKNDSISWTIPSDWTRHHKDSGGTAFADLTPLYYVRIARTADALVTPPVGTCIRIVPSAVLQGGTTGAHLGVEQPPLAIARITAQNTMVISVLNDVAYARFKEPGLRLRALTPIAQDLTVTVSYVNQAGANQTQAQSAWTAPAALGTLSVALNGADTGARSIRSTGWAITTNATEGVFAIEAVESRTPAL